MDKSEVDTNREGQKMAMEVEEETKKRGRG